MSFTNRHIIGMLSGAGSVVLKTTFGIAVVPLLISKLGLEVFSLHILLVSILEIAALLDLGASNALVKLVSGSANSSEKKAYLDVGHALFASVSLLFLVIGLGFSACFGSFFQVKPLFSSLMAWGLPLTILEAALGIYARYFEVVLLSHCEHRWTNIADSIYTLLSSVGAILLLLGGYDLPAIIAFRLLSACLRFTLLLTQSLRLESALFRLKLPFCPSAFKEVARLCGHSLTINLSILISHKIDTLIIAAFLPLAAVGVYDLVMRMLGLTIQICLKMSVGAFSLFSGMAARQDRTEAARLFLRLSSFLHVFAGLLTILVWSFHPELLALFSAKRVSVEQTFPVLLATIPCVLSGVLQIPANTWLFSWGHQPYLTRSSLLAAAANLILSIILVQFLGVLGVVLGTLIPQVIQHQAGLIRTTCQHLQISLKAYLKAVHLKTLPSFLIAFAIIQIVKAWTPMSPIHWKLLIPMGLTGFAVIFSGSLLWLAFNATEDEKQRLTTVLQSKVRGLALPFGKERRSTEPIA